jgi:hypothetical protein
LGWSELSASARLEKLEAEFANAISDLESGDTKAALRATDALTALRFELYNTPSGRARHAELEARLEAHTEVE